MVVLSLIIYIIIEEQTKKLNIYSLSSNQISDRKKNFHISHEVEVVLLTETLGTFLYQCICLFPSLGVYLDVVLVLRAVVARATAQVTPTAGPVSFLKFSLAIPVGPIDQKAQKFGFHWFPVHEVRVQTTGKVFNQSF